MKRTMDVYILWIRIAGFLFLFLFIFIMFPRNHWSLRYGPYGTFKIYKDVNTEIILANKFALQL